MDGIHPARAGTDLYAELNVSSFASQAQIHEAYRRLARRFHPDLHPSDPASADRFRRVSTAYGVLSDPGRRAAYDRARGGGPRPTRVAPSPAHRPPGGAARSAAPPHAAAEQRPGAGEPAEARPGDEAVNLRRLAIALAIGLVLLIGVIAFASAIGPYCGGSSPPASCFPP